MDPALRKEVLAEYRQLRGAGPAPYVVMGMLRDGSANLIAEAVAAGTTPPEWLVDKWTIATAYLNDMAAKPPYWWKPRHKPAPRPHRRPWPWRNRSPHQSRSTIRS